MISLSHLSKFTFFVIFSIFLIINSSFSEDEPADIWEKQDDQKKNKIQNNNKKIKKSILLDEDNEIVIKITENKIEKNKKSIIGIFDPEENNFNLKMWEKTDGEEIKKVFSRINKLKLSKVSEDLLFKILFTNSYSPQKNLNSEEFLKIKINWLIKNKRIKDLENLLKLNPEVGKNTKAIKFLIDEYLSSANIKLACENINFIDRTVQNDYLEKFTIYCLINNDRKDEAQLILDLLKERGFKEKFFEEKINFLLGVSEKRNNKILDDNLLNFYFSHITSEDFKYEPTSKTNEYIWKYLSSANLIQINDFEDQNIVETYEQAAAKGSFDNGEIFKIYLKINFNFNQLMNAEEIYKNLPNYKARALVYQSMMLNDNIENKIKLSFLLKDLFIKDKLLSVYYEELSEILKSFDNNEIPPEYVELVQKNLEKEMLSKVKFDNAILHRSKVIRHFLDDNPEINRTKKDFKSVYKKIKKNKKYFISIKDIVVLESLAADGIMLPDELNYTSLTSQMSVPKNLIDLAKKNQTGLLMLKLVEIIGEDEVKDLDPETVYFLSKILNELNLKKIRNIILSQALPVRV